VVIVGTKSILRGNDSGCSDADPDAVFKQCVFLLRSLPIANMAAIGSFLLAIVTTVRWAYPTRRMYVSRVCWFAICLKIRLLTVVLGTTHLAAPTVHSY
jgi:hypothetical protein